MHEQCVYLQVNISQNGTMGRQFYTCLLAELSLPYNNETFEPFSKIQSKIFPQSLHKVNQY